MRLRTKTLLIVATTLICLLGILYAASRYFLVLGFSKVENENTQKNVERMLDAFAENLNNMAIKCADWAKWDDTYQYIKDRNEEYAESNLQDNSIGDLKLNYMFFIDSNGQIVFGRGYDPVSEKGYEPSAALITSLLADSALVRHGDEKSVIAGAILSPRGPLILASRPIVTSEGKGPIRGAVVFARYVDDAEITRLSEITHLSITMKPCPSEELPADMAAIGALRATRRTIVIRPLNEDTIAGYCSLGDIHGKPILLGRVNVGRAIYKQGQLTTLYLIVSILIAGIVFGIIILILLEKSVLCRVAKLDGGVNAIAKSGDRSKRVALGGKDELANLASSINQMLVALERGESAIRERNRQMRLIMNTVPSGLLSLDEHFRINPEYAKSVETILGKTDLTGNDFFDRLGLTEDQKSDRRKLFDFLDLLRREVLPEKEMAGLNPFEELKSGTADSPKWLRLRYYLIERGEKEKKHILAVAEDITAQKALAEKVRASERENLQLKAILEDPELFKDFLIETRKILNHAEEMLGTLPGASAPKTIVNEIFRDIHTIKGTASSFGLGAISEIAGIMEDSLSPLRETGEIVPAIVKNTGESLSLLTKAVMDAVENAKKIMGDEFGDDADIHLRISLAKFTKKIEPVNDLLDRGCIDKTLARDLQSSIGEILRSFRLVPARKGLGKAIKIIPGLITRLQKNIMFAIDGADVPIDCEIARDLNTPLVHLIRNAFDHGIEKNPADRIALGKPAEGRVTLSVRTDDKTLWLKLADDGPGLDPETLKSVALKKGIISAGEAAKLSKQDIFSLIYRPGFSTASDITEVSGRGVGMDAVLTSVRQKLGGAISIDSEIGKGTTFTLEIPAATAVGNPNDLRLEATDRPTT